MSKQYIFGRMDPRVVHDVQNKLIKSGKSGVVDLVSQGYAPTQEGTGVLYSWKNTPLAYINTPTLNLMVFSRALWEGLLNNDMLKYSLEGKSHWMGDCHKDKDEITFDEIAGRVTNFWLDDDNGMVMGDIDVMDTPKGAIIYTCAKTGRVANSSRGFGELRDTDHGLREVVPENYAHVSWDFVTFPAVNQCVMTMASDLTSNTEMNHMTDYLKGLLKQAYERNPKDKDLHQVCSSLGLLQPSKSVVIDSKFVGGLNNAIYMHELKRRLSSDSGLFSGGERGIFSARAMVGSLIQKVGAWLKREYSGVVFSEQDAVAYVSASNFIERVEITYSLHGVGISPRNRTLIVSRGVFKWS